MKVCYIDDKGFPITKAMLKPREREGIQIFWFSTNTSSNKVKFLKENPKASIYFVDIRFFRGVSLIGTIEVLETVEAKERIWQEGDTQFYHQIQHELYWGKEGNLGFMMLSEFLDKIKPELDMGVPQYIID